VAGTDAEAEADDTEADVDAAVDDGRHTCLRRDGGGGCVSVVEIATATATATAGVVKRAGAGIESASLGTAVAVDGADRLGLDEAEEGVAQDAIRVGEGDGMRLDDGADGGMDANDGDDADVR